MNREQSYRDVVAFHGHECPGAAFGVRVAEAAVGRLGTPEGGLVAETETDTCAVDALQVLTGCTYGKRTLIHQDHGRYVFTFWDRAGGRGVRVRARAGTVVFRTDELWRLADRIEEGSATPEEAARFAGLQSGRVAQLLELPEADFLTVEEVAEAEGAPVPKRVAPVDLCVECGEPTSVETLHDHRGRMLCPACHLSAHGGTLPAGHGDHGHHPHSQAHRHGAGHTHGPGNGAG
ncbi:FmdE family protein [Streptomyces sp. N2-109]|uniref:FmdE family protein n=1 Tax=Streptomyces gossypii TaxID=2883101 RepID=A0ABT2JUL1_9ACTN|nr:FmdE family protein [Streptomyces gossypii]MCT2590979.1 FmdE family protein [Streptomyces gossypii]